MLNEHPRIQWLVYTLLGSIIAAGLGSFAALAG